MRLDLEIGKGHSADKTVSAFVRPAVMSYSGDVVFDYHSGDDSVYSNLTFEAARVLGKALLDAADGAEERAKTCPACHGTDQR